MRYDDDDLLEDGVDDWINSPEESGAVEDQVMNHYTLKVHVEHGHIENIW